MSDGKEQAFECVGTHRKIAVRPLPGHRQQGTKDPMKAALDDNCFATIKFTIVASSTLS